MLALPGAGFVGNINGLTSFLSAFQLIIGTIVTDKPLRDRAIFLPARKLVLAYCTKVEVGFVFSLPRRRGNTWIEHLSSEIVEFFGDDPEYAPSFFAHSPSGTNCQHHICTFFTKKSRSSSKMSSASQHIIHKDHRLARHVSC